MNTARVRSQTFSGAIPAPLYRSPPFSPQTMSILLHRCFPACSVHPMYPPGHSAALLLPRSPLTGLRARAESSQKTVLGRPFFRARTVVGFCRNTLSRSSISLSCWRLRYSWRVKSPRLGPTSSSCRVRSSACTLGKYRPRRRRKKSWGLEGSCRTFYLA